MRFMSAAQTLQPDAAAALGTSRNSGGFANEKRAHSPMSSEAGQPVDAPHGRSGAAFFGKSNRGWGRASQDRSGLEIAAAAAWRLKRTTSPVPLMAVCG